MPRKPKLSELGLRSRKFWPHLPEDHQQSLVEYLSWWRAIAEIAANKNGELIRLTAEPALYEPNYRYWLDVVKGIDWLLHHVPHRQEYLEWKRAIALGLVPPAPTSPATSFGPAVPLSSFGPTASTGEDSAGGGRPSGPSAKPSPRPKRTALRPRSGRAAKGS